MSPIEGTGGAPIFKNPLANSKTPPPVKPIDKADLAAHAALSFHQALYGKMHYDEGSGPEDRRDFFDRIKAHLAAKHTLAQILVDFEKNPPHADCSQFVAGCYLLAGFSDYTDTDYTGTELPKGILLPNRAAWTPGCAVFYGSGTAEHVDMLVSPNGQDWDVVGFGCEPGPGYGLLSGSEQWFANDGHPGIRVEQPR